MMVETFMIWFQLGAVFSVGIAYIAANAGEVGAYLKSLFSNWKSNPE